MLRWISFVTSHVSHPYKGTDFTQALENNLQEVNWWQIFKQLLKRRYISLHGS
jgi:hypothetical protein